MKSGPGLAAPWQSSHCACIHQWCAWEVALLPLPIAGGIHSLYRGNETEPARVDESAKTTLMNRGTWVLGSVCSETKDAGDVEEEPGDASGVSRGDDGYFWTEGLGIMGASLGKGAWGVKAAVDEAELDVTLPVLWCMNDAGTGCGRTVGGKWPRLTKSRWTRF
jgi:hypothetical protein